MRIETLYIEIINICNLDCCTCYNRSGKNHSRKEISASQIEEIIELFLPCGTKRILLSGGELSLHSELDKVLDIIEKYPDLSFGFSTNGTIRHPKLLAFINSHNNITLQISLDGSSDEQNAKTRGPGNFQAVVDFVGMINNPAVRPLLKMVIWRNNICDIEAFYEFALSIKCIPEFAFIYRAGNGSDYWEQKMLTPQQKLYAIKTISKLNAEHNVQAFVPQCTYTCPYTKGIDNMSLCIKVDGAIQPCHMLYSDKFTLGNAFSFSSSHFANRVMWIVNQAKERANGDYLCSRCFLQSWCGRGCMAAAFNLHGEITANDEDCELRKLFFLYQNIPTDTILLHQKAH